MTAEAWKRKIKYQATSVGTYKSSFSSVVDALATVLEQRDLVYCQFLEEGGEFLVEKVSDRGAINRSKNPLLQVWMDLNTQALAYWKEIGLTAAGLKKIDEDALKPKKRSSLTEALKELGA